MDEKDRNGQSLALAAALAMLGISVGVNVQEVMAGPADTPAAAQGKIQGGVPDSVQSKLGNAQSKVPSVQNKMPSVQNKVPSAQNKVPALQQKHPVRPVDPPRP
jgi:peptidoglycan hydrolase CwlO-like protein